ncbi:MAG: hypothetical protein Q8R83_03490 [Legionellaceae bacterium]|nr:hypothetical protein [Legionellaceae bacterium]
MLRHLRLVALIIGLVWSVSGWSNACMKLCGLFAGDCKPCGPAWSCDSFFKGMCVPTDQLHPNK